MNNYEKMFFEKRDSNLPSTGGNVPMVSFNNRPPSHNDYTPTNVYGQPPEYSAVNLEDSNSSALKSNSAFMPIRDGGSQPLSHLPTDNPVVNFDHRKGRPPSYKPPKVPSSGYEQS